MITISGQVLDTNGNTPLPGAQVYETLNPTNVATADSSGNFNISVANSSVNLTISFPGYDPMTDTAANLSGQDWLSGSSATLADTVVKTVKNVAKQQSNSLVGNLVVAAIILILLKIFKFF